MLTAILQLFIILRLSWNRSKRFAIKRNVLAGGESWKEQKRRNLSKRKCVENNKSNRRNKESFLFVASFVSQNFGTVSLALVIVPEEFIWFFFLIHSWIAPGRSPSPFTRDDGETRSMVQLQSVYDEYAGHDIPDRWNSILLFLLRMRWDEKKRAQTFNVTKSDLLGIPTKVVVYRYTVR